jgi:hypothetical protein
MVSNLRKKYHKAGGASLTKDKFMLRDAPIQAVPHQLG